MEQVRGENDAPAAVTASVTLKARSGGRRRSCNRCSKKKERCDGQEPCSRCARSNLECNYASCRTLGRPRTSNAKSRGSSSGGRGGGGRSSGPGAAAPPRSQGRKDCANTMAKSKPKPRLKKAAAGAVGATPVASLKRLNLSPSPATGLIGLVQNRYLTCFVNDFACYFRVLDDVTIRLGLINLMTGKVDPTQLIEAADGGVATPPPPPSKKSRGGRGVSTDAATAALRKSGGRGGGGAGQRVTAASLGASEAEEDNQRLVNAINSSVFSAMSLGAMLLGQPPSHVHLYVAVAEASLRLCGIATEVTMTVPSEHVAAAALLLAFAANVSGKAEYALHIRLARQCYDARVRHGLQTPPPIRDSLGYRAMIDALGKPPDDRGLRVPSPSKEARMPVLKQRPGAGSDNEDSGRSSSSGSSSESGGGSSMDGPGQSESSDARTPGGGAQGAAAPSGGGGGGGAMSSADGRHAGGGRRPPPPPGLEAARERRRQRRADAMCMVSDIMTMLSRVPWTAHVEEASRRTRRELSELRNLMIAEKSLLEERRFVSGPNCRRSDGIAVFALASALIGLHCALDEFSELLRLGREVAHCLHSCPGLARYQPHAYHAGLVILAASGKRPEFEALLRAVPRELRFSASSGRPLTYEAHSNTCSHPVCRKHAKAIVEMGRQMRGDGEGEGAGDGKAEAEAAQMPPAPAPTTSVTVEELPGEEEEEKEEAAAKEGDDRSMSGKVHIRAAGSAEDDPLTAETGPVPAPSETRAEKFSTLVLRPPSPPDLPQPASSPAALPAPHPEPPFDQLSPTFPGAGEGARAVVAVSSTTAAPVPAVEGFREVGEAGGEDRGQQPQWASEQKPKHSPLSFAHLQGMGRGALPAAAAMKSTKSVAGAAVGAERDSRRAAPGSGGGRGSMITHCVSNNNWHSASHGIDQHRVSAPAAYGLAAFGDGDGVGKEARDRQGGAVWLPLGAAAAGSFVGSSGSNGAEMAGFYGPHREQEQQQQQQGGGVAMFPSGSLERNPAAMTMAIQQQQQQQQLAAPLVAGSAAGTLTSRLWGVPALPPASGAAGEFRPPPHGSVYAGPRPWSWHAVAADSAHAAPAARVALSNMPGSSGLNALRAVVARAPRLATAGLPGGGVDVGAGAAGPSAAPPRAGIVAPLPSLPPSPQGKMVTASAAAMAGRPAVMTAGEASAAAISRATLHGDGGVSASTTPFIGGAIASRGRVGGAGGGGPGREMDARDDGSGVGVEAGAGGANEEEMIDLWAMIGRGDLE
eukprot:g19738.t1